MKKTNRVTLWTVDFIKWGGLKPIRYTFTSYEKAKAFSEKDYADKPVKRTYTTETACFLMKEAEQCETLDCE